MSIIPIRMLNELSYCERLFHLMHVQGLFEQSADTIEGTMQHNRAERHRRPSDVGDVTAWGQAPRSLTLGDEKLGIIGKLDAIRVTDSGLWEPVESKHSSAPSGDATFRVGEWVLDGSAWPNDQIQLCAQGLLLQANGFPCEAGRLHYRGNRKTVRIQWSEDLVAATLATIRRAQELESSAMPGPLVNSDKCFRCSLNQVCLPHETMLLGGLTDGASKLRDIVPSRDDLGTVYVTEPGSRVSKRGYELVVQLPTDERLEIPLKDVRHISLFGNVQATTQLIHECMSQGISISYLTSGGRLVGMVHDLVTKNIHVREAQFRRFRDEEVRMHLAKSVVRAKILNQRTMLRRNAQHMDASILAEMSELAKRVVRSATASSLLGVEGMAAKAYMAAFPQMLRVRDVPEGEILMNGRNRRPPKDPVNALLSLAYSLLERDMYVALATAGLDPLFGFYHTIVPGRPALVLDMMEPFRAIVADSVVIRCLNTGVIQWDDFYIGPEACALKPNARKRFFQAYERRMHETVTHPVFQYKLSYRRMLELEARFLARFLMDDIPDYRPIVTR
ncbi:CRISPR-associated exonuclease Cas4/endonuclease Cas1 fusion [Alicyclobacillus contaminans]|uniref:CRISPR-associated endonuclease Cas4g/Cas1g n=1 Tax=Alicyclobacillus contaminans TaxID=392016 RepID=UPI00040E577F|nr:CRISPR-associated endonuclease Cas1 [Alicyclobacillus contaminans]GMA49903.1 CRISPR-associated exonuclease Cas4/endonuclease Cas1 fusion [Alicyclobacillus contaminans]